MTRIKRFFVLVMAVGLASVGFCQQLQKIDTVLFDNANSKIPYRIPALAQARNGHIIALSDRRPCRADIGFGEVDVMARISQDAGQTWGKAFFLAGGNGLKDDPRCGYGDASIVADNQQDKILIMLVSGNVPFPYSTREKPNRVSRLYGEYNARKNVWQWSDIEDITEDIYTLLPSVKGLFFTSGKIHQSRKVKIGDYYRIYSGLASDKGCFVLYSDDFGRTWNVLGDNTLGLPTGDECKVEEFSNGDILLSARTDFGRVWNIFHFKDLSSGQGSWDRSEYPSKQNHGIYNTGTACNGEILFVPATRQRDNKLVTLALQSLVARDGRNDVTIYIKELDEGRDGSSTKAFARGWNCEKRVCDVSSAYSTMIRLQDGRIAFYYEHQGFNSGYDMRFVTYTIAELTDNKYF